jgi:hypothetical protein
MAFSGLLSPVAQRQVGLPIGQRAAQRGLPLPAGGHGCIEIGQRRPRLGHGRKGPLGVAQPSPSM